jgi:nucleoside 2-deoxyribosyltransferase
MQQERRPCPICNLGEQDVNVTDFGERLTLQCPRCGRFGITRTAIAIAVQRDMIPKLSAWIRDHSEKGTEIPEINSTTLPEIGRLLPNYTASQKQLLLIRNIERNTDFPGQNVPINAYFDYPLAWAANETELVYYLRSLIDRNFILRADGPPDLNDAHEFNFQITPDGWNFLQEHSEPSVFSDQAFVAMSFAPELNPIWENAIRPAIVRAGFTPLRVDAEPHMERIDMRIITEIKNSRFLIADVTNQRPGVYFEAGYAIGLGLPVIWSVNEDDAENVHFDTRQYNHIRWDSENYLEEQLYLFITALIGKGERQE